MFQTNKITDGGSIMRSYSLHISLKGDAANRGGLVVQLSDQHN